MEIVVLQIVHIDNYILVTVIWKIDVINLSRLKCQYIILLPTTIQHDDFCFISFKITFE